MPWDLDVAGGPQDGIECLCHDARWMSAIGSLTPDAPMLPVLVHDGGRLLGFLPMVETVESLGPIPIRVLGVPRHRAIDLSDVCFPLRAENDGLFESTLMALQAARRWDVIRYSRVRRRAQLLGALTRSSLRFSLSDAGASAFCDVSSPDSLKRLSKENLRNIERLSRRARQKHGPLVLQTLTDSSLGSTGFARFVALESAGWKGAHGTRTALAHDDAQRAFLHRLVVSFQSTGQARIDFLTIGGRDAAAQLAFHAGRTWFLVKIAFHPDFKDIGPGAILLKSFIERMRDDPEIQEVNLTTSPRWAERWHFETEPCFHVRIFAPSWRGRLVAASRTTRAWARRIRSSFTRSTRDIDA